MYILTRVMLYGPQSESYKDVTIGEEKPYDTELIHIRVRGYKKLA